MNAQEGRAATEKLFLFKGSPPSSKPRFGRQSFGSPVQFPLGQSDPSIAAHWPMQLIPCPQVTLVRVVSRAQQPTFIDSFEKVKAESKKSRFNVAMLPVKNRDFVYLYRLRRDYLYIQLNYNLESLLSFRGTHRCLRKPLHCMLWP